jgi:hypothetical protein
MKQEGRGLPKQAGFGDMLLPVLQDLILKEARGLGGRCRSREEILDRSLYVLLRGHRAPPVTLPQPPSSGVPGMYFLQGLIFMMLFPASEHHEQL